MANLNKVQLQGNLTRDPELRNTTSGKQVASFTLAVNGRAEKDVQFIDITAWDKLAEVVAKHKKKGEQIIVTGRLNTESWEKNGEKRSKLAVVAEDIYFVSQKGGPAKSEDAEQPESTEDIPF